jgi:aldose 1-epimerase
MTASRRSLATPGGDVETIDISVDGMRVGLLSLGAALRNVEVPDARGVIGPVHLSLPDIAAYADPTRNPHLGATVGRYANRIAGGRFVLDGVEHVLDVNNGPNTLHGGRRGFDRLNWSVVDLTDERHEVTVTFALNSPAGDMGFPGAVDATVAYRVTSGSIEITMGAVSDAPTVVNLANHGYWNLDGSTTIAEHLLEVPAQRRLVMDATNIPEGVAEVSGSAYDLREPRPLGPIVEATGGLDDCYLIDGQGLRLAARLRGATSGRTMTVTSDAPGLQVYTGNSLHKPFRIHQSVSLEAQRLPDAPNQPALGPCVLRPGEHYATTTLLHFTHD